MTGEALYHESDFHRQHDITAKDHDSRTDFRRDLARLIHCPAFRRLQGKTQLFPSDENVFFRNRLTHSLEVAQIATGIASNLNATHLKEMPVDEHLVHLAALAHDIGHPPFGHNGEHTLDQLMINDGGFEGNAQTLRILARLEKKETRTFPFETVIATPIDEHRNDIRLGLNLTFRSLASVLKYDRQIPETLEERQSRHLGDDPVKGYYPAEVELVQSIKSHVAPGHTSAFKTLECSIMDLADDIAYSTYDLEDAFKAQFLSPIGMAAATANEKTAIATEVNKKLVDEYGTSVPLVSIDEIDNVLRHIFYDLFDEPEGADAYATAAEIYNQSCVLGQNSYFRTDFTSRLVNLFIGGIDFELDEKWPCLSSVKFNVKTFKMVEILKKYAFRSLIMSPRLKIAESRGGDIIRTIFDTLVEAEDGRKLLPDDWKQVYFGRDGLSWRRRTVCDFIACMTDRYCVEFYSRLVGIDAPSIHKPY